MPLYIVASYVNHAIKFYSETNRVSKFLCKWNI